MAKYEMSHDALNWRMQELKGIQLEIVVDILKNNGRSMGGLIGSITGMNGHYDLEYIYIQNEDHDGDMVENPGTDDEVLRDPIYVSPTYYND